MYNMEIEKSVLGCLMINNKLIEQAQKEITYNHFYNELYKRLYEEILDCYKKKGIADLTVLKGVDIESLTEIISFVPTVSNWNKYKRELIDLGVKRELLRATEDIRKKVESEDADPEILKFDCLNILNAIKIESKQAENSHVGDIVADALTCLENKHNGCVIHKKWGIKWLDEKSGGIKSELTYLAARPSVGKTAFALQIAKYVAKQGDRVAIFSLEMDKTSVCNRMICNAGNIDKNHFDKGGCIPDDAWKQISLTSAQISELPIHIYDKYYTIEEILLRAEEQRTRYGLDMLILDYVQLCESRQKFNSTNDRISYISRQLKKYQQQTGIHIMALSQFNRESEQKKFPTLANLRDSGSLEQDGNNVFFLHEEYVDPEQGESQKHKDIYLIIAKQREGERNISTMLKFYGNTQRFYDN